MGKSCVLYLIRERERDRQTDRQTDRRTEKQRDRETETETGTERVEMKDKKQNQIILGLQDLE